jgi:hypothetical protein
MRKRRKKTMRRGIMLTAQANAYLNFRAEQLGLSGAEYSRRLMFLEAWDGVVFEDCRAIEEAAAAEARARQGLPVEEYLPYKQNVMARLRQGLEEIRQRRAFVLESILPQIDAGEAKLLAALQREEAEVHDFVQMDAFSQLVNKSSGGEPR